ncbi:hypothetical protein [Marinobacter mobilis]|uniref:hypothetical protein n=1 Tax=Marinobacter mobilis TaxID=488533 RepID=UPI0035C6E821
MLKSYPIEIAWVDSMGNSDSILIRPEPDWTYWDAKAECVHGIAKEVLVEEGLPVTDAAERLSRALAIETVYSDAPDFDAWWVDRLFKAVKLARDFSIVDLRQLYSEIGPEATTHFLEHVSAITPLHRAEADARRYAEAYQHAISTA